MLTGRLQGLKDIHDANIIHLDLKPSNILIDKDGFIKISDFGVSVRDPVVSSFKQSVFDRPSPFIVFPIGSSMGKRRGR